MQPRRDQNHPARRRRGLALAATVSCVALLSGCSGGPSPEDQREEMLAATTVVIDDVVRLGEATPPEVVDDGGESVACPGGQLYQYVAYTTIDRFADDDEADRRLDDATQLVDGAVTTVPGGADWFGRSDWVELNLNGDGPRQKVFFVDEGPHAGIALTVDLLPDASGRVLVRFAGTTTCG